MPKGSNISCQSLVQPEIGISRSHVTYFLVDLKIWGPKTWLELIHLRARSWGTVWLQCSRSKVISVVYSPTSWSCLISELHFPVFGSDSVNSQIPPKDSSTLIRINFCYLPWKKKKSVMVVASRTHLIDASHSYLFPALTSSIWGRAFSDQLSGPLLIRVCRMLASGGAVLMLLLNIWAAYGDLTTWHEHKSG